MPYYLIFIPKIFLLWYGKIQRGPNFQATNLQSILYSVKLYATIFFSEIKWKCFKYHDKVPMQTFNDFARFQISLFITQNIKCLLTCHLHRPGQSQLFHQNCHSFQQNLHKITFNHTKIHPNLTLTKQISSF